MPALPGSVRRTARMDWRKRSVVGSFQGRMTGRWCDPNHDDFFRSPRFEPGKLPFSGRGESPADIVQSFAQLLRGVCPVHKGGKDSRLAKSKHSFGKIRKVRVNS